MNEWVIGFAFGLIFGQVGTLLIGTLYLKGKIRGRDE